jgi:hypothetical protein
MGRQRARMLIPSGQEFSKLRRWNACPTLPFLFPRPGPAAFMLSSFACCAVHWLLAHNFSVYMVSGALFFGRHSGNVYRMAFRLVLFGGG